MAYLYLEEEEKLVEQSLFSVSLLQRHQAAGQSSQGLPFHWTSSLGFSRFQDPQSLMTCINDLRTDRRHIQPFLLCSHGLVTLHLKAVEVVPANFYFHALHLTNFHVLFPQVCSDSHLNRRLNPRI